MITVHHYEWDEFSRVLIVEFSTKQDGDEFFRKDEIELDALRPYTPPHYANVAHWVRDMESRDVAELLDEYYLDQALPDPQLL